MLREFYFLSFIAMSLVFFSCKKSLPIAIGREGQQEHFNQLTAAQKEAYKKMEHASYVLQGLFIDKNLRQEFNNFIGAKLERTKSDEELTFREILNARTLSLKGVKPDFLQRFKSAFVKALSSRHYPNSAQYNDISLGSEQEIASYFGLSKGATGASRVSAAASCGYTSVDGVPPYMIYFPYSENFTLKAERDFTISFNTLDTSGSVVGNLIDSETGDVLEEDLTVDDDYAYENPTYLLTYDDGLQYTDFVCGVPPIQALRYHVQLTDDNYNPVTFSNVGSDPAPEPTTSTECRLAVKDGRWTMLRRGYGFGEGAIEFAVAISKNVSEVNVPNSNSDNPLIRIDKTAQAWAYYKIRRGYVKDMENDENQYVSFGMNVGPWCPSEADKMMFLYEYDSPGFLNRTGKAWEGFVSNATQLIADPSTRSLFSGVSAFVKAAMEGSSSSKIEHYSILGSKEVAAHQRVPSEATRPKLLNGYRVYGFNGACVSLVID